MPMSTIRVKAREHEMAGQRRLDRDLGRLAIAHLADHNDVGVVTEDRPEDGGERETDFRVDRDLGHALHLVLDWVFDRDDLHARLIQAVECAVERRAFARTSRARDEHYAMGLTDQALETFQDTGWHAEIFEISNARASVENAEDYAFAMQRRRDRHTEVELAIR